MEAVPGGLSGGGYNSNEENSAARIGRCPSSAITAALHAGAITWAKFVPNIESGRLMSFWQHECDEGMFIEPHCCAMCLQQSRSASVISAPGIRHAITGRPDKTISNRTLARWRIIFTSEPVYAHFGVTGMSGEVTTVTGQCALTTSSPQKLITWCGTGW